MDQAFVSWLEGLRAAVAATRASREPPSSNGGRRPVRDKRLDDLLPMQFEHNGQLLWAENALRFTTWSSRCCVFVGAAAVFVLLTSWWPGFSWMSLAAVILPAWGALRWLRWRERPARQWQAEAEVVPGALVYANTALYEPGTEPANAGFVFTFDAALAADPDRLKQVAQSCFDLHRALTAPAPALAALQRRCRGWSERLPPGQAHVFDRVQVPEVLCGNEATFMTIVAVSRDALPRGVIDRRIYPLLARSDRNECAALLPWSYWGTEAEHATDATRD